MSKLRDEVSNKLRKKPSSAHAELIDHTDVDVNVNVNKRRRPKFEDLYTRRTFYVRNDLLDMIEEEAGNLKGEKVRIINEALEKYFDV